MSAFRFDEIFNLLECILGIMVLIEKCGTFGVNCRL